MSELRLAETRVEALEAENHRLRQRVARLGDENRSLRQRVDWLEQENGHLRERLASAEAQVDQFRTLVEAQQRALDELQIQNAALVEKMLDLESRLAANSNNSSKPPSSDGPEVERPERRGRGAKRKRGGQPGHRSTARAAILPEHADSEEHIVPERCAHCDAALHGCDPSPIGRPVYEIPKPTIGLTWYWLHRLQCEACGHQTRASAPGTVGQSRFGVNIHALLAVLVGRFRQSKRLASELFELLYGLNIPPSSICDMEKRTSAALEVPTEEVRQHLARAPVVHGDETGWRRAKEKAWLWLVATSEVAYYRIDRSRGGKVIRGILGEEFAGVVVADRWSAYKRIKRAFCWSHLRRDFRAMHERHHSEWHGVRLENAALQVLQIHKTWRNGEITWVQLQEEVAPLRETIDRWLVQAAKNAPGSKARSLAGEIGRHPDCVWRFLTDGRIAPTNNFGERLIRPSVIVRSLSQGNDTDQGAVFTARILSTIMTLRLQDRNSFDFLVEAIDCHNSGRPAPSLLPVQAIGT